MAQALTKYFGPIEFQEADLVRFPFGLPSFEEETQFLLIEPIASAPLIFLQSLRQPALCFLALPILEVDPRYHLAITQEDLQSVGLEPAEHLRIGAEITCLAILAVTEDGRITANLLAPIVINRRDRRGLQAIRIDSAYCHEHPVTELSRPGEEGACS